MEGWRIYVKEENEKILENKMQDIASAIEDATGVPAEVRPSLEQFESGLKRLVSRGSASGKEYPGIMDTDMEEYKSWQAQSTAAPEGELKPNFDTVTQEPLTDKGMEICASRQECFEKHLIDKIFRAGKEKELSNLVDIAKAAAKKDNWYKGNRSAPWFYKWEGGLTQGFKDEFAGSKPAADNPDSVDPDANNDGQLSPDALRRIADKVEAGAEEKEELPAPTMSKIDKLEALKKIDAEMKSGEIDDLEALRRMKALKGK